MNKPGALLLPMAPAQGGFNVAKPVLKTEGSAAFDLQASIDEPTVIEPGETALVPAGFVVAISQGHIGQVQPRADLATHGIAVVSLETIDCAYRGEVEVPLINNGNEPFHIKRGDRIAQMVVAPARNDVQTLPDPSQLGTPSSEGKAASVRPARPDNWPQTGGSQQ